MRFSELDGKTAGVWGVGIETRSFASQVRRHVPRAKIAVVVVEDPGSLPAEPELLADGARVVAPGQAADALRGCDVLVRSPGVSHHRAEIRAVRTAGVVVTTATGLWFAERRGRRIVGITGTKGKSTTAALLAHLAKATGTRVQLAGNIGRCVLDLLDEPEDDLAVVELSSFQIADLPAGPEVAVVTNLHNEHLDWHGSAKTYRAEKLRLLRLPEVVTCVLDGAVAEVADRAGPPRRVILGSAPGWRATERGVMVGESVVVAADALPLRGAHNARNLCAALAALEAVGLQRPPLPVTLEGFGTLPHRLEVIHDRDGVLWVDDSVSTTPEAAMAAVSSFFERRIVLLGGGYDRGQDYCALAAKLAAAGATVIGMPSTGARLVGAARAAGIPADRALKVADLTDGVRLAHRLARPGTVVLLSPAAASYDRYPNFASRGKQFRAVLASITEPGSG